MNTRSNILWIVVALVGCSGSSTSVPPPSDGGVDGGNPDGGVDGGIPDGGMDGGIPDGGTDGGMPDGGTCVNTIQQAEYVSADPPAPTDCRSHVCDDYDSCAELTDAGLPVYPHNPPIGGPHYWVWANWGIHEEIVPRGYWVHNLEHGGVVFLYRPDAPQSLKDAITRVYNAIPPEQDCVDQGFPDMRRAVVTPDPLLDTPWAVTVSGPEDPYCVGFGYYIKGDCIASEQALVNFAVQHRDMEVETICDDGAYPP